MNEAWRRLGPPFVAGLIVLLLAGSGLAAQAARWYVLSRSEGCVDLALLARAEKLPRVMRGRGHQAMVGLPKGFPEERAVAGAHAIAPPSTV